MLDPKNPAYIKPEKFLESEIIIDTISSFIKGESFELIVMVDKRGKEMMCLVSCKELQNTCRVPLVKAPVFQVPWPLPLVSKLPIGALGIAAASVERAYQIYQTGVCVAKPWDFSANSGTAVAGYIKSINKLSMLRWEAILEACGVSSGRDDAVAAEAETIRNPQYNSLDGLREGIYTPSSPS
ncbi:hypothetical protein B0H17DRAFT_1209032 [Mycena rosella]|uniref:Uncharacterized protein n=1 Tax=Mycena rosella TaxID=1033263 RepID=A0AAD7CGY7_MYCRO|nr:hypothetical protein B0H17DRAFT_1215569 [Mycena rosella]KAJ7671756.1 hypothetical protein B0H17DRAFT_1209032 [Mycena rosella]